MEAPALPPRRRETTRSLQLQRASDQLQEAIQSARRGGSSHATSLSLLSDLSAFSECSSDGEDGGDGDDQENQPLKANAQALRMSGSGLSVEKPSPEQKLRRFMADSMGSTGRSIGASLSMKDLLGSPLRPAREQVDHAAALKLQLAGECESGCAKGEDVPIKPRKRVEDDHLESQTRQAIDVLQREVEAQARANRDAQEQLKLALAHINSFVKGVAGLSVQDCVLDDRLLLDAATIEKLDDDWTEKLNRWKEDIESKTYKAEEKMREFEEEMEKRMRDMEVAFERERDGLKTSISVKQKEMMALQDTVDNLERKSAEEKARHCALVERFQRDVERLQMQNEEWLMLFQSSAESKLDAVTPSPEENDRHVLSLLAQLKEYELRDLQWEMMFQEQTQSTRQVQERLNMLLEDVNCATLSTSPASEDNLSRLSHHFDQRTSLASSGSAASTERHFSQQRIQFLEDQLRDLKEQIHCDHHQFLYEQQKWDLERKHLGQDVEEVHGVSVKVLKMLLIREKLLKKQEKKARKRRDELNNDELQLREKQDTIHASLEMALQECGVALLYVRQLAMTTAAQQPSSTLPVKPIKLVRVIKRLKSIQQDVASPVNSSAHGNHSPTTSSSTWTSRAPSTGHQQFQT